jgi:mycothiol synthase
MWRMADGKVFHRRPIAPGDAADWAELLAAIRQADGGWEYFTQEQLLEDFEHPLRDFDRGSVAVYDGAAMVGYGALVSGGVADPVHEMRCDGGVHPAYRGRGIGSSLLGWAEEAAVPLHRERFPGRPLSLMGSCVSTNAEAAALFAAHGYQPVRWFHAMERDLAQAVPEPVVPPDAEIVGYTLERSAAARLVYNEAFRDHWGESEMSEEEWDHFIALGVFRPALSFLAYADGEPAGVIFGFEFDAYAEETGVRDLYIPLIGTRRAARKRGIASALLRKVLTEAKAAGFGQVTLKVDADSPTGALGLYQRTGFVVDHSDVAQAKSLLP